MNMERGTIGQLYHGVLSELPYMRRHAARQRLHVIPTLHHRDDPTVATLLRARQPMFSNCQ